MTYTVKEIFITLQGEGARTGTAAIFCRFAGCNLWSGREEDRAKATCTICDTDFVGGRRYDSYRLVEAISSVHSRCRNVVLTGGEPLLQVDDQLIADLKRAGFHIAVETNGTIEVPAGIDWICVSPKTPELKQTSGNELKLPYRTSGLDPSLFEDMDFDHFSLQPIDGSNRDQNIRDAIYYCMSYPKWRLSMQAHKIWGLR